MTDNTENHTLTLLRQIRNDIKDHLEENRDGFKNVTLQLAAMNKKLSGQFRPCSHGRINQ